MIDKLTHDDTVFGYQKDELKRMMLMDKRTEQDTWNFPLTSPGYQSQLSFPVCSTVWMLTLNAPNQPSVQSQVSLFLLKINFSFLFSFFSTLFFLTNYNHSSSSQLINKNFVFHFILSSSSYNFPANSLLSFISIQHFINLMNLMDNTEYRIYLFFSSLSENLSSIPDLEE